MQAVIIAGGLGTRLRPLTYTRPKPLIPLLNKPMILHILDRLPREIEDVILPVNYMVDHMRDFFRENDVGRNVTVIEEATPLGTGGALKNVEALIKGRFLAFNGDVISSISVRDLVNRHEEYGGIGTIALWKVDNPSAFGAVELRNGNRISKFIEKPKLGDTSSKLINAGAYVFEREVLKAIPAKRQISMEREIFPKLVRRGLFGYRFDGYWSDAGTLKNYIRATKLVLASEGTSVNRSVKIADGTKVEKPVFIGWGCKISGTLGPNASLGKDCTVEEATVKDSALFDEVTVKKGAVVTGSIIGEGCRIGSAARLTETIVGDGETVAAGRIIGGR